MTRRTGSTAGFVRFFGIGLLAIAVAVAFRFNLFQPATQTAYRALAPVQGSLNQVALPGADALAAAQDAASLRATVEQQRQVIDQLTNQIVRARELELENQRLREELNLRKTSPGLETQAAAVIGQDPTNLIRSVTIDKGDNAGLQPGMVVIDSAGALVGRVSAVMPTSAKVVLLTDPSSSVYAMIQDPESRAVGLVDGMYGPYLKMRLIAQTEKVERGDVVITSGRGPNYPKGLYVGRVLEVHRSSADPFQEAIVEPAARLSRLEHVLVITNFLPQVPN